MRSSIERGVPTGAAQRQSVRSSALDGLSRTTVAMLLGGAGSARVRRLGAGVVGSVTRHGGLGSLAVVTVTVPRLQALLADRGIRDYLFAPDERRYCDGHRDTAGRYAARLAAKLALRSFCEEDRTVAWRNIRVAHDDRGAPVVLVRRSRWAPLRRARLSLSHAGDVACAVLVLGPGRDRRRGAR